MKSIFTTTCMTAAGLLLASVLAANAQGKIDPKRGAVVAETWCAACHVVSADQESVASADVPPFSALTLQEGFDDNRLRAFLRQPHGPMEGVELDENQIADLIAYIRTQAN
ncbi:c-type cytochrome [Tepidamorphus sp. 3E244]|uniref:c-type cytochrome n=1 Tax=Tepidamorphus sp. 3E244 TaxID=3385498 RepID=UPI0038FC7DFA